MKIKILIILFSITIILFPTQFVIGAFHEEAEQFLKEKYEEIDPIKNSKIFTIWKNNPYRRNNQIFQRRL